MIGHTRSAYRYLRGRDVRMVPFLFAGGFVALPLSHASHLCLYLNLAYSGRVLSVSNEMYLYLLCSSVIARVSLTTCVLPLSGSILIHRACELSTFIRNTSFPFSCSIALFPSTSRE